MIRKYDNLLALKNKKKYKSYQKPNRSNFFDHADKM